MGDMALAGSRGTFRSVQLGEVSSRPNEEGSRQSCRLAHWFWDMRNSYETRVLGKVEK